MTIFKPNTISLSLSQELQKRIFDIIFSSSLLFLIWWFILLIWVLACIDSRSNGFYFQSRVGRHGKVFKIIKIKTMRPISGFQTFVTCHGDPRITILGNFFRRNKIDEFPQLWNVLRGDMSFVGPRPDVIGYSDMLNGEDRIILSVRPGITGPAQIAYKNEEEILANQVDAVKYNDEIIWPDKVKINCAYIKEYSFFRDLYYIWKTLEGGKVEY